MSADDEPQRVKLRPDRLRKRKHDPAGQRSPKRTRATDDGGFECDEKLRRAGIRIERCPHRERAACDASRCHGNRGSDRRGATRVDTHQARRMASAAVARIARPIVVKLNNN